MKKIILLTIALLVVVTLSGCGKNNSDTGVETKDTENEEVKSEEKGGMMDSIKEALTSNKKMECVYTSNEDGLTVEVKTYIQGDKYKTEFLMGDKKNNSIFDGKVSYSWEEGSTEGIKIDIECINSLDDEFNVDNLEEDEEGGNIDEVDDLKEEVTDIFEGAQNVECHETGSIDFSIPADINFADQCEMLKNQQQMMNDLSKQIPEGMPQF